MGSDLTRHSEVEAALWRSLSVTPAAPRSGGRSSRRRSPCLARSVRVRRSCSCTAPLSAERASRHSSRHCTTGDASSSTDPAAGSAIAGPNPYVRRPRSRRSPTDGSSSCSTRSNSMRRRWCTRCGRVGRDLGELAEDLGLGLGVDAAVGAVVEETDELDAGIVAALQCASHLHAERAGADDDGGAARLRPRRPPPDDGSPQPGRQPLQDRRDHRPGEQDVVLEVVEAARRVGAQRQDRQQHQPGGGDVDGGARGAARGSGRGRGR